MIKYFIEMYIIIKNVTNISLSLYIKMTYISLLFLTCKFHTRVQILGIMIQIFYLFS